VTERQLQEAIQQQVRYGGRLGTSLYELGFITEERLQEALAKAHGVAAMPVDLREVSPSGADRRGGHARRGGGIAHGPVPALLPPRAVTTNAAVFPVLVKGRVVNLVYADNGTAGNVRPSLGELLVLLQRVPRAYLRIIRRRVAEARKAVEDAAVEAEEKESE
jgi:hypothetical protein